MPVIVALPPWRLTMKVAVKVVAELEATFTDMVSLFEETHA